MGEGNFWKWTLKLRVENSYYLSTVLLLLMYYYYSILHEQVAA
jgi:hypothetical protein